MLMSYKDIRDNLEWIVAMYENKTRKQFHFVRKCNDIWLHKKGLYGPISCFDTDGNMITDINNAKFYSIDSFSNKYIDYELDSIHKLTLKK